MLFKPILWAHMKFLTFSGLEVSRETQSTAVSSRQTDFEAGNACFSPSLATWTSMGENWVAAMKFEISGSYSSGGLFQARGPGKVLPFHPGPSRWPLQKALTDHAMLNVCVV